MMLWAVFVKSFKEQLQDWWVLLLIIVTAPCFVLLYWMITSGGSTVYALLFVNKDTVPLHENSAVVDHGEALHQALRQTAYPTGQALFDVRLFGDQGTAQEMISKREAAALLVVPPGFSASLASKTTPPPHLTLVGDLTNPSYVIAAVMAFAAAANYVETASGRAPNLILDEQALGGSAQRSEFDYYVPGVFIVSILMMLFSAAMNVAREIENGTLARLRVTRLTAFHYMSGVSALQVLVGLLSLGIALVVAWLLGFQSSGSLWAVLLVGALTALPVVGMGLIVASLSRTLVRAFIVANVPFMLMAFFSGAIYPVTKIEMMRIGSYSIGVFDFLPTTHAVNALNRIMTLGASPLDLGYEMAMLCGLSVLYFATGVLLFQRLHFRTFRRAL